MDTVTVNLSRAHLRAALCFAATNDVRYYLNGVHVEVHGAKHFTVATDGEVLCAISGEDVECAGETAFTIPSEAVKAVKASGGPTVSVTFDAGAKSITVKDGPTQQQVRAVEGVFPPWRRVLPAEGQAPEGVVMNPALFGKMVPAAKALGKKPGAVWTHHSTGGAAVVQVIGVPEFVGVVMGLRPPKGGAPAFPNRSQFDRPQIANPLV